jgi:hypothetical protein
MVQTANIEKKSEKQDCFFKKFTSCIRIYTRFCSPAQDFSKSKRGIKKKVPSQGLSSLFNALKTMF